MDKPPPPLPKEISDYITHGMPPDGWCTQEKAISLAQAVLTAKPGMSVELGVYTGRSLFAIALALRHLGAGHVIAVDPWQPSASIEGWTDENRDWWGKLDHNKIYDQFMHFKRKLGLDKWISTIACTSDDAFRLLTGFRSASRIDLLHIDGNHNEAQALRDVEGFVPMVPEGGLVYFDDLDWKSTLPAQQRLVELCTTVGQVGNCGIYRRRLTGD